MDARVTLLSIIGYVKILILTDIGFILLFFVG